MDNPFKVVIRGRGFKFLIAEVLVLSSVLFCNPAARAAAPTFLFKWGHFGVSETPGVFAVPRGVAIDAVGNVYVTDTGNERVQKFTEAGVHLLSFNTYSIPDGIDLDDSGNIYVLSVGWGNLSKFDPSGNLLATWGSEGSGDEQFQYAYSLVVKGDMIYVGDRGNNRIQTLTTDGQFRGWWRGVAPGVEEFAPLAVALDSDGNLLIAGLDRILRFTTSGSYLGQFSGDGQFNGPSDIAVDDLGNIYVSDSGNNRIEMFDAAGNFILSWESGFARFDRPRGLAVNSGRRRIYIVDSDNAIIQVFDLAPVAPAPRPTPALLLHIAEKTGVSTACSSAPDSASQVVTSAVAKPDGSAEYFLYLLASPTGREHEDPSGTGLTGIQLGIEYDQSGAAGEGIEIVDWRSCSGLEWKDDPWPASASGITQTWVDCQYDNLVVAGYFDVIAYSPSIFSIVGWPHTAMVKTAGCDAAEQVLEELSLDHVGWVSLGGAVRAGDNNGCNPSIAPCAGAVPVHKTTWGTMKSMFKTR